MSTDTLIQQGRFISAQVPVTIPLRSGVDWMKVYNKTVAAAAQTTAVGVEYYWQRGFGQGEGWEYLKSNAADAANWKMYFGLQYAGAGSAVGILNSAGRS